MTHRKTSTVRQVKQGDLSDECWMVQIWGLGHCETCEYKDSAECGGQQIRKTGKNAHGHKVPIGLSPSRA